jgi:hypothetical protein
MLLEKEFKIIVIKNIEVTLNSEDVKYEVEKITLNFQTSHLKIGN